MRGEGAIISKKRHEGITAGNKSRKVWIIGVRSEDVKLESRQGIMMWSVSRDENSVNICENLPASAQVIVSRPAIFRQIQVLQARGVYSSL